MRPDAGAAVGLRGAAVLAVLAVAPPGHAQPAPTVSAPSTVEVSEVAARTLDVGEHVRIRVGALDDFVVLDPAIVSASVAEPGVLDVVGTSPGRGTVLVLTPTGTLAVPFTVERPVSDDDEDRWVASGPRYQYQTVNTFARYGALEGLYWATWHQLDVQDPGVDPDRRTEGHVALAVQQGQLFLPLAVAEVDRPGVRARIGDTGADHVPGVAATNVRGASVEVDAMEGWVVQSTVGASAKPSCCSILDPNGEFVAQSDLRRQWGQAWASGGLGLLVPLQEPVAVPRLLLATGLALPSAEGSAFAGWLGQGAAFGANGRADITDDLFTDLRWQWTTRGFWVPRQGPSPRATTLARGTASWAPLDEVRFQPLVSFVSRGSDAENARVDTLTTGLNSGLRLGDPIWTVDTGYFRGVTWEPGVEHPGLNTGRLGLRSPHDLDVGASAELSLTIDDTGRLASMLGQLEGVARPDPRWQVGPQYRGQMHDGGADQQHWIGSAGERLSGRVTGIAELGWWFVRAADDRYNGPNGTIQTRLELTRAVHLGAAGYASLIPDSPYGGWRADLVLTVTGVLRRGLAGLLAIGGGIEGVVFLDEDGDAVLDSFEEGIAGVDVEAFGRTTRTEADGSFRFVGLPAGPKTVSVDRKDLFTVDGTTHEVEVPGLGRATTSFALSTGARILVRVFEDRDHDGDYDAGENGVGAERLTARAGDGRTWELRAEQGLAEVSGLGNGSYTVELDAMGLPPGYVPVSALSRTIVVDGSGAHQALFAVTPVRTISGRVWIDVNQNGKFDGADRVVAGATVTVHPGGEVVATDANGRYLVRRADAGPTRLATRGAPEREVKVPDGPARLENVDLVIPGALAVDGPPQPVAPAPAAEEVVALRITPSELFLPAGERRALVVTAAFADLSRREVRDELQWVVEDPTVVAVTADGVVEGLRTGSSNVTVGWRGRVSPAVRVEVGQIPLVGLDVRPSELVVEMDEVAGLYGRALYVTGDWSDATSLVTWSSDDETIATVGKDGVVHGIAPGTTQIRATLGGVRTPPVQVRVGIDRAFPGRIHLRSDTPSLSLNRSGRIDVEVTLTDGRVVNGASVVAWEVADADVLQVLPGGRVVPREIGSTEVSALWKGVRSLPIAIEVVEADGLLVSPPIGRIPLDARVPLTATAVLRTGATEAVEDVEWRSADPDVAAVEGGVLVPRRAGRTEVVARWRNLESTPMPVEILPSRVTALEISPTDVLRCRVGETQWVDAVAVYADGERAIATPHVTFTVDDAGVAQVDSSGAVTALAPGTTVVRARWGTLSSTGLAIEARAAGESTEALRVVVAPEAVRLAPGSTTRLSAEVVYTDGRRLPATGVSWVVEDRGVAMVDAEGRVRPVAPGVTRVVAETHGTRSSPVAVHVPEVLGVTISPPLRTVPVGSRIALRADGVLDDGALAELSGVVEWTTSDERIAWVDPDGGLLAVRAGRAEIRARSGALASDPLTITVVDEALERLEVTPADTIVPSGGVVQLTATSLLGRGVREDATQYVVWSSSRPDVVDVADGLAAAARPGEAQIFATWLGKRSDPVRVRVLAPDLVGLTVGAPTVLLLGAEARLRASAVLESGEMRDRTTIVDWHVSDASVATVDGTGRLRPLKAGRVEVWAALGAIEAPRTEVQVVKGDLERLDVEPKVVEATPGTPVFLTVEGTLADGRTVDLSDQVDWRVEGAGIAVGPDGLSVVAGANGTVRAVWATKESPPVQVRATR